jgi:hypothetical protein
MAIIIAVGIIRAEIFNRKYLMMIYLILFSLQLFYLPFELNKIIARNENATRKHASVLSKIPVLDGHKIMVPWEFVFNKLPDYNLVNDLTYKFPLVERGERLSQRSFFQRAIELNIQFIVYDKIFYSNDQEWLIGDTVEENPFYEKIYEEEEYFILERKYK